MDSINWDAIGALAEALGSVGVFISLIYLAVQMRQNATETREASVQSVMQLAIQVRAESFTGDLVGVRLKAARGESLTMEETLRFEGYLSALFELNELAFAQQRKNMLDEEYFAAWERRTAAALEVPAIRQFWLKSRSGYRDSFVEYIDGLIESRSTG